MSRTSKKYNREQVHYEDLKSMFLAERPREVDGIANASAIYYKRWMMRKLFTIFDFTGMPDTWDIDYLLSKLFINGYFCICDTSAGVLPLECGYSGINIYSHPTECIIANPVLGSFTKKIDVDCSLVKLQYDYNGVNDMLNRYAFLLASCDSGISVNLTNSKVTFIGLAKTKAQAETLKKMYDEISMGKPAVFYDNSDGETNFFFNNVKQNFIAQDIHLLKENIKNDFLTEIGINNINRQKRERLNTEEVTSNNDEVENAVEHWLLNIRQGLDTANKLFNMDLSVKLRYDLSTNDTQIVDKEKEAENEP